MEAVWQPEGVWVEFVKRDDENAIALSSRGAVRTTTARAYAPGDGPELLAEAP
jgi:hypothetical protein